MAIKKVYMAYVHPVHGGLYTLYKGDVHIENSGKKGQKMQKMAQKFG